MKRLSRRIFYIVILLTSFVHEVYSGDTPGEYPIQIYPSHWNSSLDAISIDNYTPAKLSLESYLRQQTGIFRNIYQGYYKATYSTRMSSPSLYGYVEKEGDFISRNRFYINYSVLIPISSKLKLGAGISGGVINFAMNTETQSISINRSTFDANSGLVLCSRRWLVEASMNQIPGGIIESYSSKLHYKRFFQGLSRVVIVEQDSYTISCIARCNIYTGDRENELFGGINIRYANVFSVGMGYNSINRFVYVATFALPIAKRNKLDFLLGYETGKSRGLYVSSVIHGGLVYKLNNH